MFINLLLKLKKVLGNKGNDLVIMFIILAVVGIAAATTLPDFLANAKAQADKGTQAVDSIDFSE